jgi:hypothetical protein
MLIFRLDFLPKNASWKETIFDSTPCLALWKTTVAVPPWVKASAEIPIRVVAIHFESWPVFYWHRCWKRIAVD